jgi:hypothetical protein
MNLIPFVFTVLLILSYNLAASFQSRLMSHRNQKAYLALRGAELDILRKSEQNQFLALPGDPVKKPHKKSPPSPSKNKDSSQSVPLPEPNAPCARLNIYPLIIEGRDRHAALYETTAKLLRTFYQRAFFPNEKRFEYKLLDAILGGAKTKLIGKNSLALETVALKDPTLQLLYYSLLKGTKQYSLGEKGYPPLTDYLRIEKDGGKICLFHCHLDILTVFFGPKTAAKLLQELKDKKAGLTLEAILEWGSDPQLRFVDQEVWSLIDFNRPQHPEALRKTLLGYEDGTSIRKQVLCNKKPASKGIAETAPNR